MAEPDESNESYELEDPDVLNPAFQEEAPEDPSGVDKTGGRATMPFENNVKRNAIIAAAVFFVGVVIYKFISAYVTEHRMMEVAKKTTISPPPVIAPVQTPVSVVAAPAPPAPSVSSSDLDEVRKKVAAMQLMQQNSHADFSSVTNQLADVSNTLSDLSTKLAALSQRMDAMSVTLQTQSQTVTRLEAQARARVVVRHRAARRVRQKPLLYVIQAVIPGRAWLVDARGRTMTVQEGSTVPGYGIVRTIDAMQGRILTSSGKMIRFNAEGI
jgi:intracellular multiplication protein IcmG